MKYVIFKGNGCYHPVLFADHTTHSQIKVENATPISAGFVKFNSTNEPTCYGKADSLKLESNPEQDEQIIHLWQRNHGMSMFIDYDSL